MENLGGTAFKAQPSVLSSEVTMKFTMCPAPSAMLCCSLGRRSFFTTTDEDQWQLIRKGTAQAFSQANIRCAVQGSHSGSGVVMAITS